MQAAKTAVINFPKASSVSNPCVPTTQAIKPKTPRGANLMIISIILNATAAND